MKIEGRQRSAAYVAAVTQVWRQALDACAQDAAAFAILPRWTEELRKLSEGSQCTLGAYDRPWK